MSCESLTALVTGGAQGLGLSISKELIACGCTNLVVTGLPHEDGDAAEKQLRNLGASAHFIAADFSDFAQVQSLMNAAEEKVGNINALVNSAAICDRGSLLDTSEALFDRVMGINLKAPFFLMQDFSNRAIASGAPAACVNITSLQYHCGLPFLAPYTVSKAGVAHLTKNAANALAKHRIRFNAIALGWMDSPGEHATQKKFHNAPDNWLELAEAGQPFGQLIKTDEVARLVAHLLSPESGVITGAVIDYDQTIVGASPPGVGEGD